jgi:hypothetical protein
MVYNYELGVLFIESPGSQKTRLPFPFTEKLTPYSATDKPFSAHRSDEWKQLPSPAPPLHKAAARAPTPPTSYLSSTSSSSSLSSSSKPPPSHTPSSPAAPMLSDQDLRAKRLARSVPARIWTPPHILFSFLFCLISHLYSKS